MITMSRRVLATRTSTGGSDLSIELGSTEGQPLWMGDRSASGSASSLGSPVNLFYLYINCTACSDSHPQGSAAHVDAESLFGARATKQLSGGQRRGHARGQPGAHR